MRETEPRRSYKSDLIIECHAGIEMKDGIFVNAFASRTSFKRIESFTDYSTVNNRVLKFDNGQAIPILGIGAVLIFESPRIELLGFLHVPGLHQKG